MPGSGGGRMKKRLVFAWLVLVFGCGQAGEQGAGTATIEGRTVDEWVQDLREGDATRREEARQVLARLGPDDRRAVPALGRAARDENASVRLAAVDALGRIGHPDCRAALVKAMQDPDPAVSRLAVRAYSRLERSLNIVQPPQPAAPPTAEQP
jgi:HEAT repeats